MLAVSLCSVMLVSSIGVYADTGGGDAETPGGVETQGGVETPGGADLNEIFKSNSLTSEEDDDTISTDGSSSNTNSNESDSNDNTISTEESSSNPNSNESSSDNTTSGSENVSKDITDSDSSDVSEQGSTDQELEYFPSNVFIDLSREVDVMSNHGTSFFMLNESTRLPVSNSRFDYFAWSLTSPGTATNPGTGMGIKYIQGDPGSVDAEGNYRLVYCLSMFKDSPGLNNGAYHDMDFTGWTNRKIAYAMFYGPLYWGETARWSPYSTGNWEFDYWVTQMAVHILNGEITYDALYRSMFNHTAVGGATNSDKTLVMNKLRTIINDANDMGNYTAFDSDYWINFSKAQFNCSAPASNEGFYYDSGSNSYVLNGAFTPSLTMEGQDYHHRASFMTVNTNAGYINHWNSTTMHPFALHIPKAEFEEYQKTGKDIRITVDLGIPKKWGGAIYKFGGSSKIQPVTLLSFESRGDVVSFHREFSYRIPKIVGRIGVAKTSGNTAITNGNSNYSLAGAVYTVYRNSNLSEVVGTITTDANGYGWLNDIPVGTYYVKETEASPGYSLDTTTYTVQASS